MAAYYFYLFFWHGDFSKQEFEGLMGVTNDIEKVLRQSGS